MPFVNTITNVKISQEKAEILKTKYGKAITLIPTKTESGLMLSFIDDSKMFKAGHETPCAFIELRIYSTTTKDAFNDITVELTKIMNEELGIAAGNVYINLMEFPVWGSGGRVF